MIEAKIRVQFHNVFIDTVWMEVMNCVACVYYIVMFIYCYVLLALLDSWDREITWHHIVMLVEIEVVTV